MLRELHVRNLAVLAEAEVVFGDGLNILTGETGAGKSMLVDSLFLLAGARASTDLIRGGADSLSVAGVFSPTAREAGAAWQEILRAAGLVAEEAVAAAARSEEVLVRREIGRNGRNRVFVNDQPTTLRLLAELSPWLLRIHGQRDEMDLLAADLQRGWLDRSGGDEAGELLARTAAAYDLYTGLAGRLERVTGDERARLERADLLRFQLSDIDAARLRAGEDHELRQERAVLRHVEAITRALGASLSLLSEDEGSALERIGRSGSLLAEIAEWELQAAAWGQELDELRIRLTEVAAGVRRRLDGCEAEPGRLDAVEERLAVVERLCHRYSDSLAGSPADSPTRRSDVASILVRREAMGAELAELEGSAGDREELAERVAAALETYRTAALSLSQARERWGQELARAIERELADLGLGKARLGVALVRRSREGSPLVLDGRGVELARHGIDQVTLLFAPNPGEEPRPLSRIASGGELSRLHLALQLAARGEEEGKPVLVFDEVDTGIGGAEAAALGRKLQRLARDRQILAVTHLPQVASHADRHFKVAKQVAGGRTRVEVAELNGQQRVEEVARMLAGESLTPLSLSHAREMIAGAAREGRPTR